MLSSVTNALRVVDLLGERGESGVSEIARDLNLTTATAHRLVQTLTQCGYVDRDPKTRRYTLGPRMLLLARQASSRIGIVELIHPVLEDLASVTSETVNLATYHNGEIIYLDKIDSSEIFRVVVQVGSRLPAFCTALGRALLAHRDASDVSRYLHASKFAAMTPETITDPARLAEEIGYVRKNGFAIDYGEVTTDVMCAAAPVVANGKAAVALSVTAPRSRFENRQEAIVEAVLEAARRASALVGAQLPPE